MGKCGIGVKIGDDMNRQLLHRLGGIFDTHQILASDLYREIYSRDGSYFDIKPEIIVRPIPRSRYNSCWLSLRRPG